MRKLLITLIAAFGLLSCTDSESTTQNNQENIIKTFSPIIEGSWVLTDYVNVLQQTKSPKASSGILKDVVYMRIDPSTMDGDTLIVSSSLNNHEGYTFYLFMREGQNEQSLQTGHTNETNKGFYELSYNTENGDTALWLNYYNEQKELTDKKSFTKITGPSSENGQPLNVAYMANKVLFSGNYTVTDKEGKTTQATLTDDGLVTGIADHSTYYVFTDFMDEDETNLDELLFDERTKNQKGYIFEIAGDTTRLYKALENEDRTLLVKGELTYTMVRE